MKKIIISAFAVFVAINMAIGGANAPYSMSLPTNSVKIAPSRGIRYSNTNTEWAVTNLYSQGDVRSYSNRWYMCMTNGTSGTSGLTHRSGVGSDGTLDWYYFPGSKRDGLVVHNLSATNIFFSVGYAAVAGRGIVLAPFGNMTLDEDVQEALYAIPFTGQNHIISIQEF